MFCLLGLFDLSSGISLFSFLQSAQSIWLARLTWPDCQARSASLVSSSLPNRLASLSHSGYSICLVHLALSPPSQVYLPNLIQFVQLTHSSQLARWNGERNEGTAVLLKLVFYSFLKPNIGIVTHHKFAYYAPALLQFLSFSW